MYFKIFVNKKIMEKWYVGVAGIRHYYYFAYLGGGVQNLGKLTYIIRARSLT